MFGFGFVGSFFLSLYDEDGMMRVTGGQTRCMVD